MTEDPLGFKEMMNPYERTNAILISDLFILISICGGFNIDGAATYMNAGQLPKPTSSCSIFGGCPPREAF